MLCPDLVLCKYILESALLESTDLAIMFTRMDIEHKWLHEDDLLHDGKKYKCSFSRIFF